MQEMLNNIDTLMEELRQLRPLSEKNQSVLREKFRLEWNYNSNHIEGNTMTYGDTKLLLRLGDEFIAENNTLKEVNEMRAHDVAIFTIEKWAQDEERTLTESDIRELNKLILVKNYWADAITSTGLPTRRKIKVGEYKEHPNHVLLQSGEKFYYAEPSEVPAKMEELLKWYNESQDEHPLITAAFLHYKFVLIHPFDDGNGRVSRLVMNYHLMKNGYPPIIVKSADKKNYLYALNQADAGKTDAFLEYLGEQLLWSLDLSIKAAKGESVEEEGDLVKEIEVWKKQVKSGLPNSPKRSDKVVMNVFDESISTLFDTIVKKLKIFEGVFQNVSSGQEYQTLENEKNGDFNSWFQVGIRKSEEDSLGRLSFRVHLRNYLMKPDEVGLSVELSLTVVFNTFQYVIQYNTVSDFDISKTYEQVLSGNEIDAISDRFIKILFERVKERIN